MDTQLPIIRKLTPIEEAWTITNKAHPLGVVCVLHLTNGPDVDQLQDSLQELQRRHPLLQANISKSKQRFYFTPMDPIRKLEAVVIDRQDDRTYQTITEQALNTIFEPSGPLMQCWYLPNATGPAELIVGFHHAIIDGQSARLLLHELLSLLGRIDLPEAPPLAVADFPPAFKGPQLAKRILRLMGRQFREEWRYQKKGLAAPIPKSSNNAILRFQLSDQVSRKLAVQAGRQGLSLNSVLLAAITLALYRQRYETSQIRWIRALSFVDLRSTMVPPLEQQELGSYVSMLRLKVPITSGITVGELAPLIRNAIFQASRQEEVVLMSIMSKQLVKMALSLGKIRLGVSALSFIGKLDLEPTYGAIQLMDVEAYITNNRFGPEFSAFGKILFGRISLDFTYLTAEWSPQQAQQIADRTKDLLENMANFA